MLHSASVFQPALQLSSAVADHSCYTEERKDLSVDFDKLAAPRARSSSVSAQTVVEEDRDCEIRRATVKRRGTHAALVKLSWLDVLKATFFGTKGLRRRLAATIEWAEDEGEPAGVRSSSVSLFTCKC